MLYWPILFIALTSAQESSIEEFCFSSSAKMQQVVTRAKFILVPSDEVQQDGSCLTIKAQPHRRELIQNYIRNLDPAVRISFSSAEVRKTMCELKIERVKEKNAQNRNVILNQNSSVSVSEIRDESQNVAQIKTLGSFELTVNQDVIKGNCRFITPQRYEIDREVRKDPKPIYPQVAEKTLVIITHPTPPPIQETSRLKTVVQLDKGQRLELGSVISNLQKEKTKVENTPEAFHQNANESKQEKVFLSID